MSYDDALDLPRDEDGRIVGFAVGKEARMRDWEERKESERYAQLFHRLESRRYMRRMWAEYPERMRAISREWKRANRERVLAQQRARNLARRSQHPGSRCRECRLWFAALQWRHGAWWPTKSSFCTQRCRNRYHGRARAKGGGYGGLKGDIGRVLRTEPWLTAAQIRERLLHRTPGVVRSRLSQMVSAGAVVHDGKRRMRRHALPDDTQRTSAGEE